MTTTLGPSARSGGGGLFALGLTLGAIVGFVAGLLFTTLSPGAGSATHQLASIASAPVPALKVTLGRGRVEDGDMVRFPVQMLNTGEPVNYAAAHCSFYGKDGALLDTGLENWTNVAAGAQVSGSFYVHLSDRRFTYNCYGES